MAVTIIDVFEMVQVDEQHGKAVLAVGQHGLVHLLPQAQHEGLTVRQFGEIVGLQAFLHVLETLGQLPDFVGPANAHRPVELAVAHAFGGFRQMFQITRQHAQNTQANGDRHKSSQRAQNHGADHVVGHTGHEVAARHGHHGDPLQAGVVFEAVKRGVDDLAIRRRETERLRLSFGQRLWQPRLDFFVNGRDQRIATGTGADPCLAAVRHGFDVGAGRRRDQVAIGLNDESQAIGRHLEAGHKIIERPQRHVGGHNTFKTALRSQHSPGPGGHKVFGDEVDVDRCPGVQRFVGPGLVPGALARVKQLGFVRRRRQLAVNAGEAVKRTHVFGFVFDAQLALGA